MLEILKKIVRPYYFKYKEFNEKRTFENLLKQYKGQPLKVVIGSARIYEAGWLPSEAHFLDLLEPQTWERYFQPNQLDALLAEHVWEHLSPEQGLTAARTCYQFLRPGGRLRVAVPDGFHSNPDYIEYVRPGGHGAGADDHKVLYTYKTFSAIFEQAGFKVELLEYFDENGKFHASDWNKDEGFIHRSIRYDKRNTGGIPNYTSLILDAVK